MKQPSNSPWYRIICWIGIVALSITIGAAWGKILGNRLALLSYDYPAEPAEYIDWGTRFGFLTGSVIAACQSIGQRPMASLPQTLVGLMLTWGIMSLGTVAGAGIAYQAYNPATWQLPNPNRYAFLIGVTEGRKYSALLGLGAGVYWVWRSRKLN